MVDHKLILKSWCTCFFSTVFDIKCVSCVWEMVMACCRSEFARSFRNQPPGNGGCSSVGEEWATSWGPSMIHIPKKWPKIPADNVQHWWIIKITHNWLTTYRISRCKITSISPVVDIPDILKLSFLDIQYTIYKRFKSSKTGYHAFPWGSRPTLNPTMFTPLPSKKPHEVLFFNGISWDSIGLAKKTWGFLGFLGFFNGISWDSIGLMPKKMGKSMGSV